MGEIIATIQQEQNDHPDLTEEQTSSFREWPVPEKLTVAMRISYILYNYGDKFRPEDFPISSAATRILLNYITSVLPDLDVYGVSQMTMEQLFVRFLYEDWDPRFHRIKALDAKDKEAWVKEVTTGSMSLRPSARSTRSGQSRRRRSGLRKNGVLLMDEKT